MNRSAVAFAAADSSLTRRESLRKKSVECCNEAATVQIANLVRIAGEEEEEGASEVQSVIWIYAQAHGNMDSS